MRLADLDFFLVGAARAGTTTMWSLLLQTPGVYLPRPFLHKEPGYFSELTGLSSRERYLDLFRGADETHRVRGEASTAYLTDPASAGWIAREAPDARILILLRNPADRAYSLYNWMVQEGYEWLPSFDRALREERRRVSSEGFREDNPEYFYNYLYFRSGRYAEQVERYFRHFGEDRVHVALFEDLVDRPRELYREVLRFLRVPAPDRMPEPSRRNPSRRPYSARLQHALRRVTRWLRRLRPGRAESKASRDFLLSAGLTDRAPEPLSPDRRERLLDAYSGDIRRLEELLGRDLSRWAGGR